MLVQTEPDGHRTRDPEDLRVLERAEAGGHRNRDSEDLRVLERAEAELEDVGRALRRLDEGSYASCEACGRDIDDARLQASPVTRRCADHAEHAAPSASAGT